MAKVVVLGTPVGTAMWSKVNTVVDVDQEGKRTFQVKLELEPKDEVAYIKHLKEELEKFKALPENQKKVYKAEPKLGFAEDEKTGKTQFTFKTKSEFPDTKTGEEIKKTIPVKDRYGNDISNKAIGNGSKIQVGYQIFPWYKSKDLYGISLLLHRIKVLDLIEYGGFDNDIFDYEEAPTPQVGEEFPF